MDRARETNRKRVMLRLTLPRLADLLHLPADLEPLSLFTDPITGFVTMVFTSKHAVRDVATGNHPPAYNWEELVARSYAEDPSR